MEQSPEIVAARVVCEYTSETSFGLSIREGETVNVLEDDDGTGWIKVANGSGKKGLVPVTYLESVQYGASVYHYHVHFR